MRTKYTVKYNGSVFYGDQVGAVNRFDTDRWEEAIDFYNVYTPQGLEVWIEDNEYGVTFENGEWS